MVRIQNILCPVDFFPASVNAPRLFDDLAGWKSNDARFDSSAASCL